MTTGLDLAGFLSREGLDVLDIARGAAPGTRRVVVGDGKTSRTTNVVALASDPSGWAAIASEARSLHELDLRLRPALRATVPAVQEMIAVGDERGVVLSAVPRVDQALTTAPPASTRESANAVLVWLRMFWEDTAGPEASVDLGRQATEVLTTTLAASRRAAHTLAALQRSRAAVSAAVTARTSTHGCLCPRHVRISDGSVTGVDDWGLAELDQEPLRDLGAWVVASAGPRIDKVFKARSRAGRAWRDLVSDGLGYWGLPRALWRDVLVLSLAEAAVAGLARADDTALDLLTVLTRHVTGAEDLEEGTT